MPPSIRPHARASHTRRPHAPPTHAARDIVEPAIKPGNAALQGIGVVAPLVRKLGPNANPAVLNTLPLATGAMFAFYLS